MLEKNKNYIEFSAHFMVLTHMPYQEDTNVAITGMIPGRETLTANNPFDIPCDVVVIPKRAFERLQADNQHYREMAKQWEENHNLLLKKTGFDTVESLVFYLTNFGCDTLLEALASYVSERDKADENYNLLLKKTGFDTVEELVNYLNSEAECDTLREAIASLEYNVKFARDERRDLSKKLEECEKDYISARDKAEALQTENEQLKKKLHEFDPIPDYKELLEKLYSKEDVEKLEWTLNHICGGQASVNGWRAVSLFWSENHKTLSKLVGFSSVEEIQDYLTNEAECDTLHGAISKLKDQVKYTCDEWYSANSTNNSWKAAAECNSPKELIEKREALEKELGIYSRALKEWKEGTCCPSPSAAKTLIESGMSYEYAYHEAQKENRKLTEEVDSWKAATGYSIPEDYLHARLNGATPFDYTASWQKATGCDTPDQVKSHIEGLENAIRLTNKNMIKEIENTIDEWQTATGCVSPEKAQYKITDLYNRIDKMKEAASIASNWTDKIVEG